MTPRPEAMSAELPLDWILEKTPKGRDELATRAHHLLPGQRNLLIMADGRRAVSELLKAGTDPQRCMQVLRALFDEGFLVRSDSAAAASGFAPLPTAAPAAAPVPPGSTPHATLIALVQEQFGAHAPRLLQKIEQHPDTPEGRAAAVQSCAKFIRLFIDEKQADLFVRRAQELQQE